MMCRLLLNVQQFGLCIAIILSIVSYIFLFRNIRHEAKDLFKNACMCFEFQ